MAQPSVVQFVKSPQEPTLPALWLGLLVCACLLAFSPPSSADVFEDLPELNAEKTPEFPSHLWRKDTPATEINLLSPRLMSDKQLMQHAELIRENHTNNSQRLLNNMWLTMEQSKRYEGAQALCKLLSFGYLSYRRALTPAERANPFFQVMDTLRGDSLITHFKHYDIEVSTSAFKVSVRKAL